MSISQIIFFSVEGRIKTPYDEISDHKSQFDRQQNISYAFAANSSFRPRRRIIRLGVEPREEQEEPE